MMKSSFLYFLTISSEALTPPRTPGSRKTILHNYSISGQEKRTNRQSIAPLSPNTGAVGSPGPISNNYRRRTLASPDNSARVDEGNNRISTNRLPESAQGEQSLLEEVTRLRQSLKERDDDVETLIYEVHRLRELNAKVKDANDARSNDFTYLKKEAERLKHDFETRTIKNEENMAQLVKRLKDREARIAQLEEQVKSNAELIADLEMGLNNGMSSPSLGASADRVPLKQYKETKSFKEDKNMAVVGGAPVLYRSQKQSFRKNGVTQEHSGNDSYPVSTDIPINNGYVGSTTNVENGSSDEFIEDSYNLN